MTEATTNGSAALADQFLEDARDTAMPVSLYLVNGYQLKGKIDEFDEGSILFEHKNTHQLVMRSAVASMYPLPSSKAYAKEWWRNYTARAKEE